MTKTKSSEFECYRCKGVFDKIPEKQWSEKDREEEAADSFGSEFLGTDDQVSVCDDCYNTVMSEINGDDNDKNQG